MYKLDPGTLKTEQAFSHKFSTGSDAVMSLSVHPKVGRSALVRLQEGPMLTKSNSTGRDASPGETHCMRDQQHLRPG
jgi:hypothetical protein